MNVIDFQAKRAERQLEAARRSRCSARNPDGHQCLGMGGHDGPHYSGQRDSPHGVWNDLPTEPPRVA